MIYALIILLSFLIDLSLFHNKENLPGFSLFFTQVFFLIFIALAQKRESKKINLQIVLLAIGTLIISGWFVIYTNPFFHDTFLFILFLLDIFLIALITDKKNILFKKISNDFHFTMYIGNTFFREIGILRKYYSSFSEKSAIMKSFLPKFLKALGGLFLLLIIIVPLLFSADQVFAELVSKFFENIFTYFDLLSIIERILYIFIIAFILFTLYESLRASHFIDTRIHPLNIKIDKVYNYIILGGLNALYIIFIAIQIKYTIFVDEHTFHTLGISYGEYIHSGFYQLIIIALINYGVYVYFHKKTHSHGDFAIKINLTLLIISTLIISYSAFTRIILYIEVYHLTELRVFVVYILTLIVILFILTLLDLYHENSSYSTFFYRICLISFVVLGYANIDKFIAEYNLTKGGNQLDRDYILNLSNDAIEEKIRILNLDGTTLPQTEQVLQIGTDTVGYNTQELVPYTGVDRVYGKALTRLNKPPFWYYNYYQEKAYSLIQETN